MINLNDLINKHEWLNDDKVTILKKSSGKDIYKVVDILKYTRILGSKQNIKILKNIINTKNEKHEYELYKFDDNSEVLKNNIKLFLGDESKKSY